MTGKKSKAEQASQRRKAAAEKKRNRRIIIGGVVGAGLVVVAILAVNSPPPEELVDVQVFPDLGGGHLADGEAIPEYNSDPPTSGPHSPSSAQCGIYTSEIPDIVQIHNLEHGTVVIQYQPELPEADVEAMRELARSKPSHILLAPRPGLGDPVVLTSWKRMLPMDSVDVDTMNIYYGEFVRTGPEVGVACAFAVDESA